MLALKPIIRITILSVILTSLLIYLGVKYHWGDHLKINSDASIELSIPDKKDINTNIDVILTKNSNSFNPKIINKNTTNTLLDSMNKEQIAEQCLNLLRKEIKDPLILELATVNCVVSNHQETFQNAKELNDDTELRINKKKQLFNQQCRNKYKQSSQYSILEKQILESICVSDKLNMN